MERFARIILTALIGTVALGQFVQVITRYVLEIPVMGLEEMLVFPAIWLYILGAVNASREDQHIRANVLELFLKSDRARLIQTVLSEVISIAIGLWLLWWAWDYTAYSLRVWRETPTLFVPTFWVDVSLFVGLVLMLAYTALHLARHVARLAKGGAHG